MKIKKEQLIPIIAIILGLILVVVGVILFAQNKDTEQNNKNTEETLAKEYFCTRELTTDEYEMQSEYHIYADDNGNLIRNQFDMKTTYLTDVNGNNIYALLYENNETDLILEPLEAKTIQIRFNATYRNGLEIDKIEFDNIVRDQDRSNSSTLSINL